MAVSKDQVITACETLLTENGKAPNQSQVRELLGGGSFSTIAPIIAEWKKNRTDTKLQPTTANAPDDIQKVADMAVAKIWQTAEKLAEERLASEREALKTAQQEAINRVTDLEQFIATLEKDLANKSASFNDLLNEKNTLSSETEAQKEVITALTVEKSSLTAKLEEYEQLKKDNALTLKELADSEKALATATAESNGKDKQIELLNNQMKETTNSLTAEIKALNKELTAEKTATDNANRDLKLKTDNLSTAEKQIATLEERGKRIDTLEPQIAKLTAETAEAKAELKITLKALETAKKEPTKPKPRTAKTATPKK